MEVPNSAMKNKNLATNQRNGLACPIFFIGFTRFWIGLECITKLCWDILYKLIIHVHAICNNIEDLM